MMFAMLLLLSTVSSQAIEDEIHFQLDGFGTEQQRVLAREESVAAPSQEITDASAVEIVFTCGSPCTDDPPASAFERPLCSDYDLHDSLIDSMRNGDPSAAPFLQRRRADAISLDERNRLSGALLRRIPDDAALWNELAAHADIAVRFAGSGDEPSPEYLQWCTERGLDPNEHWWMAQGALAIAAEDARSRPLLLRALATSDDRLIHIAVEGLGKQQDFTSLPLIAKRIEQLPETSRFVALSLAHFVDERADALARKYLDEPESELYEEFRMRAAEERSRSPH